jgi:tetratricopeptide (TPR) repeat protein
MIRSEKARIALGALLLSCVTLVAYLPAMRGGFIWDDNTLVAENPLIRSAAGLHDFWLTTRPTDYWPVTMSVFWLEWRLWGADTLGYHAVNLGLHIAEALLLWAVLRRLGIRAAFLGALLFAVHPVNVETVAWISELKNLLALLFLLASAWWFLKSGIPDRAGAGRTPDRGAWGLSLLAFTLGMLSKGSIAILPVAFLGVIGFRRRLVWRDLVRLAPFFALGAGLAAVDVWFQRHGAPATIRDAGPVERLLGAGAVVWFYLGKALWPAGLCFVYPQWRISAGDPLWWLPLAGAVALTALLIRCPRPWARAALPGWGFFCLALVPVMGFTDVYYMKYSLVADHYQHIALIGIAALAAAGWGEWTARGPVRWMVAGAAVLALAGLTWRQSGNYRSDTALYEATLARNPGAGIANVNLGVILASQGKTGEAIAHYRAALQGAPDNPDAWNDLGNALARRGSLAEAAAAYAQAIRFRPDFAEAHCNWANALGDAGRYAEAAAQYGEALRLRPGIPDVEYRLANALANAGSLPAAIGHYRAVLRLQPGHAEARANLGLALNALGRSSEALAELAEAVRLKPGYPEAHAYLGLVLAGSGRLPEAVAEYRAALRLRPGDADVHYQLGIALRDLGEAGEAAAEFDASARLQAAQKGARRDE